MGKGGEGCERRKGWFSKRRRDERRAARSDDPHDALTGEHRHARRPAVKCFLTKIVGIELEECKIRSEDET